MLQQHDDESMEMPMATKEETTDDAIAKFAGTVTRCPPGEGRAPDAKEYGRAQFKCRCGHAGTMAYPKLYKQLRRRKPLRLAAARVRCSLSASTRCAKSLSQQVPLK
jgi:hypothetical protein